MHWPQCHSRRQADSTTRRALCTHPRVHATGHRISRAACKLCRRRLEAPPDLFRSFPFRPDDFVRRPELQLVVARYREDVGWLDEFAALDTVVYDKGGNGTGPYALPNVGREAHTYLHHIVENYDRLAEVTVFLQGNPYDHCTGLAEKIWALDDAVIFQDLGDTILVEDAHGRPIHWGLPLADRYAEVFDESPPEYFTCRNGACFAVSREAVRARPRTFYKWLLSRIEDDKLGAYWMERFWQRLFAPTPRTRGIVTAADARFFQDLQYLLHTLEERPPILVLVYDLGMTATQRAWCSSRPLVACAEVPCTAIGAGHMQRLADWQIWIKPFLIYGSPFDQILWIDADCLVLGNVEEAFELIQRQPLIVREGTDTDTENDPRLYRHFSLNGAPESNGRTLNAGVVGLCRKRDAELLAAWMFATQWIFKHSGKASLVAWQDQGLLLWAVRRFGLSDAIRDDLAWNQPAGIAPDLIERAVRSGTSLLAEIGRCFPETHIVHWLGCYKLSHQLRDQLADLFRLGFSGNGPAGPTTGDGEGTPIVATPPKGAAQ